ncbi:MAG TPA: TylF/MycF/NovP-related O-methyltransferase [Bacteroidia bacterium]|nr:TylF/MycF/NovP-related O-methyltransferase [Bacteroidia bacterium]
MNLLSLSSVPSRYRKIYKLVKDYTMIPEPVFYDNLELAEKYDTGKGCIVECGVWRGGMSAAMGMLLGNEREIFLFDSFEGLPPAKELDGEKAISWQKDTSSPFYFDNCKASEKEAETILDRAGIKNRKLVKGFFSETLPSFTPPSPISVLRLDGDWYDSTMDCLENLYKFVAPKGLILIDDYYLWDGCARAVHDFLSRHSLPDRIRQFNNGDLFYIIKG